MSSVTYVELIFFVASMSLGSGVQEKFLVY